MKKQELTNWVLQDVLRRLDTAFRNFFEGRTKYPRTKSYVSSITYPQASPKWIYKNSITLPKDDDGASR